MAYTSETDTASSEHSSLSPSPLPDPQSGNETIAYRYWGAFSLQSLLLVEAQHSPEGHKKQSVHTLYIVTFNISDYLDTCHKEPTVYATI